MFCGVVSNNCAICFWLNQTVSSASCTSNRTALSALWYITTDSFVWPYVCISSAIFYLSPSSVSGTTIIVYLFRFISIFFVFISIFFDSRVRWCTRTKNGKSVWKVDYRLSYNKVLEKNLSNFSSFSGKSTMSRVLSRILSCGNDYIASTVYKKVLVHSRQKEKRQNPESRFCLYMAQTPSHALPLIAMPNVEGWYVVALVIAKVVS